MRRLATYRAVFDDFVARWGGRIFSTAGDAALAEFPSSVDAVRCAVDIQDSIEARNLSYPPDRRMLYRIGITVADVVERDGDLLGDGVNVAARLGGIAMPGGICVSHAVYEQVANKLSVKFEDLGQQQVKNIPNAIHAYGIAPHTTGVGPAADDRRQTPRCGAKRRGWPGWRSRARGRPGHDRSAAARLAAGFVGGAPHRRRSRRASRTPRPPFDETKSPGARGRARTSRCRRACKIMAPAPAVPPRARRLSGRLGRRSAMERQRPADHPGDREHR